MNLKTLSLLYEKVTFVLRVQRYVKFLFLQTFSLKKSQLLAKKCVFTSKTLYLYCYYKRGMAFSARNMALRAVLTVVACVATLGAVAQSSLRFTRSVWDFGTIREDDGKVSCTFEYVNRGKAPVVIDQVNVSCGCTTPEFSRKPIKAGERGQLKVTFDPANRAGEFAKEITVFTGGRRYRTTLRITGNVIARTKTVEELYPAAVGDCGLRIDARSLPFNYVTQGERKNLFLNYINTSSKPINVRLVQTSASGFVRHNFPTTIAAGASGRVTFGYSVPRASGYFGELNDVFELVVEGCESDVRISTSGYAIERFEIPNNELAPKAEFDRQLLKFEEVQKSDKPTTISTRLTNNGREPLIIRSVRPSHEAITTSIEAGATIAPSKSVEVRITIDPSKLDYGRAIERIVLITNDPERPMRQLRVTGVVR